MSTAAAAPSTPTTSSGPCPSVSVSLSTYSLSASTSASASPPSPLPDDEDDPEMAELRRLSPRHVPPAGGLGERLRRGSGEKNPAGSMHLSGEEEQELGDALGRWINSNPSPRESGQVEGTDPDLVVLSSSPKLTIPAVKAPPS